MYVIGSVKKKKKHRFVLSQHSVLVIFYVNIRKTVEIIKQR